MSRVHGVIPSRVGSLFFPLRPFSAGEMCRKALKLYVAATDSPPNTPRDLTVEDIAFLTFTSCLPLPLRGPIPFLPNTKLVC